MSSFFYLIKFLILIPCVHLSVHQAVYCTYTNTTRPDIWGGEKGEVRGGGKEGDHVCDTLFGMRNWSDQHMTTVPFILDDGLVYCPSTTYSYVFRSVTEEAAYRR
jgi:hypothetical protein